MTEILSSAQMRAVERAAIESGEVSGLELMERAGVGVVGAILESWPEAPRRAVVLCGPGNNGGDGYVIARLLAKQGWNVTVWAPLPPATPDAQENAKRWSEIGGTEPQIAAEQISGSIVIDALFGTGLGRSVARELWYPLALAQEVAAKLVAVDILSGLCADSGELRAEPPYLSRGADLTVTFQAAKLGHYLLPAGEMSGVLRVVDIGLSPHVDALAVRPVNERAAKEVTRPVPGLFAKSKGHKFSYGHLLVLTGGVGRGGAGRMAARAALRIGAGLVTVGCPPAALIENASRLDAVMLTPIADPVMLGKVLSDERINAICVGPGLGLGPNAASLVAAALDTKRPTVLDADALTLIAQWPDLRTALHGKCVLTPHTGEFARLWPDLIRARISKAEATLQAAKDCGAVVLHKGPDSVIATPEGNLAIHASLRERLAPWLATAGAGDVLAGLIAGLLARGFLPAEAAAKAVWLHVEAGLAHGPGLIAEDLPEALPGVLRRLEA